MSFDELLLESIRLCGIIDNGSMYYRIRNALYYESTLRSKSMDDIIVLYTRKDFMAIPSLGKKSWEVLRIMKEKYNEL